MGETLQKNKIFEWPKTLNFKFSILKYPFLKWESGDPGSIIMELPKGVAFFGFQFLSKGKSKWSLKILAATLPKQAWLSGK